MAKAKKTPPFDVQVFLNTVAGGRTVSNYRKNRKVFAQGDPGDAVFYIQEGRVKVCVVSEQGKEAVVALHGNGDFFGENCLNGHALRVATVVTVTDCVIMRIEKAAIVRVLQDEPKFSEMFMAYLLSRNSRVEEDLVDQLFNSSEKRLARVLLLMANFGKESKPEPIIPKISQGDASRDGGHHKIAREHVHEQVPQARIHRIQRSPGNPQFPSERCVARQSSPQKTSRKEKIDPVTLVAVTRLCVPNYILVTSFHCSSSANFSKTVRFISPFVIDARIAVDVRARDFAGNPPSIASMRCMQEVPSLATTSSQNIVTR